MRKFLLPSLSALFLLVGIGSALARDYDTSHLDRYDDAPWDRKTNISVSVLTEAGILMGNPDGTFRPEQRLNRAEFMQIAMRLLPEDNREMRLNCFPDVFANAWYAEPVCRAKYLGIVRGNADPRLPSDQWRFEPVRDVQYEEAVKVLVNLYALPISGDTEGADWYLPYLKAAEDKDLALPGMGAGDRITRGEMARLVAGFLAYTEGELADLRAAERGDASSSSSVSSSRSSSSVSSSRSSSSLSSSRSSSQSSQSSSSLSSSSSIGSIGTSVQSDILLLGEVSPLLLGVQYFSNAEPVDVTSVTIELVSPVASVESILVYNQSGQQIGTASAFGTSGTTFRATLPTGTLTFPRREDVSLSVRARLKLFDSGGVSGEEVEVESIQASGTGQWSNDPYSSTSNETFVQSETARAEITAVTNAGPGTSAIFEGTNQLLGSFRFDGRRTDSLATLRLSTLRFQIEQAGGVTVTNPKLRVDGSDTDVTCSILSTIITCSGIPATHGTINMSLTLRLYGDVTLPSGATVNPSLRIILNDPGSINATGAVTWTDGSSTFNWLPLSQPVVRGTQFN